MARSGQHLVEEIRYVGARRPAVRAAAAAVLLLPALGREPLTDVDVPVVLLLVVAVVAGTGWALRRVWAWGTPPPPSIARAQQLLTVATGSALLGLLVCLIAVVWRLAGAATIAILLELAAAALTGWAVGLVRPRRADFEAPAPQPSGSRSAMTSGAPFAGTSIACSGGGIRAASFCLGALQRLRQTEPPTSPLAPQPSLYDQADRVYAVSGGGYIATALHMARRHSPADPATQADLFAPGSPEEDWLRRRSQFLLPSGAALVTGFLSLLYGIAVNLTLVAVILYSVALYAGWLHSNLATVCPGRGPGEPATCLGDGALAVFDSRGGPWFFYGWGILLAGLALFVLAKALAKYVKRGRLMGAGVTRVLITSGLAVGLMLVVLPWLMVGLNNAALQNRPTVTVAKALTAARLATPDGCLAAVGADLRRSAELAWQRAPAAKRATSVPFAYGGCGGEWTDDAVVFAPGGVALARPADGYCNSASGALTPTFCDDLGGDGKVSLPDSLASWVGAVVALSVAVRGVLGGSGAVAGAAVSRRARLGDVVRRVVLPWVASAVIVLVALTILLVALRDNLLRPDRIDVPAVLLAGMAVLLSRLLSDAMLSSLHPFYRERLSDTFLVRRRDGVAEPLPYALPTHVHQNSALTGPDLVVCCAANIQDRDWVPAGRGAVPFLFRTDGVHRGAPTASAPAGIRKGLIGLSDSRLPEGRMRDAEDYSACSDPQGLDTTLAAAMAASGAAFSPRVGRMDKQVRPYRMLLALANARLGVWLPNPYLVEPDGQVADAAAPPTAGERWQWFVRRLARPGPFRIFQEAFGRLSAYDSRIYVTDGGHYDNTALVEALRDRPSTLFLLDASADAADSLDALGDAIVTARMDLGLVIRPAPGTSMQQVRRDPATLVPVVQPGGQDVVQVPQRAQAGWAHLVVSTVDRPEETVCDVWFVKNVRTLEANIELDTYAAENADFPITGTGNQFYGEYDVEAYRLLGYSNTTTMLAARAATGLQGASSVIGALPPI